MFRVFLAFALMFALLTGCGMTDNNMPDNTQNQQYENRSAEPQVPQDSSLTQEPLSQQAPQPNMQADASQKQIASFTTPMLDPASGRVHNIRLAAQAIDNYVLVPGAVFSFNDVVGERTAERGYLDGATIVEGERRQTVGGGVCQLSSTLCNAAWQAGLDVLERHDHQRPVGYVETGKDASVSYGYLDFRFRNNLEYSIQLRAFVSDDSVTVEIYRLDT